MSHSYQKPSKRGGTRFVGCETSTPGPITGPRPKKEKLSETWNSKYFQKLLLVAVVEFFYLTLETLVSCLGYAFYGSMSGVGPAVSAAMALVAYFTASNMMSSMGEMYFGNSILVALQIIQFRVGLWAGLALVAAHFGARFAGAGIGKMIADSNFANALFNKSAGVSSLEALIVEIIGGIMVILLVNSMYKKFLRGRDKQSQNVIQNSVHAIMIGFVIFATQAFAHPITGAAFDPIRWIAVTAVGGGHWGWWYPVASVIVLAASYAISFLYCHFKKMINKAGNKSDDVEVLGDQTSVADA